MPAANRKTFGLIKFNFPLQVAPVVAPAYHAAPVVAPTYHAAPVVHHPKVYHPAPAVYHPKVVLELY